MIYRIFVVDYMQIELFVLYGWNIILALLASIGLEFNHRLKHLVLFCCCEVHCTLWSKNLCQSVLRVHNQLEHIMFGLFNDQLLRLNVFNFCVTLLQVCSSHHQPRAHVAPQITIKKKITHALLLSVLACGLICKLCEL